VANSTDEHRPEELTPEIVLQMYKKLLVHKIRQFRTTETVEDCLHQVLLQMMTKSETLGTSYLERYNPDRGTAKNYVVMFCTQQMMKMTAVEANRRRLMPEPVPITYSSERTARQAGMASESVMADPSWEESDHDATIRTPGDLRELLAGTPHAEVPGWSQSGEPQSTVYMLELMLWGGLNASEVARRLDLPSSSVRRRVSQLKVEPKILVLRDNQPTEV
jgi:hypothetical protein